MLEGYTTLGLPGRAHPHGRAAAAGHRRHLPASRAARQDRVHTGRALRRAGGAGHRCGLVRARARGLGVPFPPVAERFERLEETLQIVHQMWSDDNGPFEGRHYQLAETINSPQPLSAPHPPIMIGGGGEKKTLRLVAKYADACNLFAGPDSRPGAGQGEARRAARALRARGHRLRPDPQDDPVDRPGRADPEGGEVFAEQMAGYADDRDRGGARDAVHAPTRWPSSRPR